MHRIVLALALTGAAGLIAPQCHVRAPRAGLLRAEPAGAAPRDAWVAIDVPGEPERESLDTRVLCVWDD